MTSRILAVAICAALRAQTFDVASVKPSARTVGPDYNNRIVIGPATFSARNVTLKRLIGEAYGVAPAQLFGGPKWLAESEYDVEAKAGSAIARDEMRKMLQPLLAERFHLAFHRETREMKIYELIVDKGGPRIQPGKDLPGSGHFKGDLDQLADLISIGLTIPPTTDDPSVPSRASGAPVPVFNRTGLAGSYDFHYDWKPEPGIPAFNRWQTVLQEQLGLKLESRRTQVEGILVDSADRVPAGN